MKLLNWAKYGKTTKVIILIKLKKWHYAFLFKYLYSCFQTIFIYSAIMCLNNFKKYFTFNNIDDNLISNLGT